MSWMKVKFYALCKPYPLRELVADLKDNFPEEYEYTKLEIEATFPATASHTASVVGTITCSYYDEDFGDLDVRLFLMTEAYPLEYTVLAERETFEYRSEILREDGVPDDV
ncbi:hypothetical protein [Lacticaseibacillus sp. GG6-2]